MNKVQRSVISTLIWRKRNHTLRLNFFTRFHDSTYNLRAILRNDSHFYKNFFHFFLMMHFWVGLFVFLMTQGCLLFWLKWKGWSNTDQGHFRNSSSICLTKDFEVKISFLEIEANVYFIHKEYIEDFKIPLLKIMIFKKSLFHKIIYWH